MKKIILNSLLVAIVAWAISVDYCLKVGAVSVHSIDFGMLTLGLVFQVVSIAAFFSAINFEYGYFNFIKNDVNSRSLKATLLVLPFALLFFSHDPIAHAIYGRGDNSKKIESAKNTEAALRKCKCGWISLV